MACRDLLEAGVAIHARPRPSRVDKVKHLDEVAKTAPGEIKYFKADLMKTVPTPKP